MTPLDMLAMAFMNLWRRKLRSILTMLGMVIGTTSIVVLVSLGIGINKSYEDSILNSGSITKITIGQAYGNDRAPRLNDKTVKELMKRDKVKTVMPVINSWGMAKSGKYAAYIQVYGIDPKKAEEFSIKADSGKMFSTTIRGSEISVILTADVATNFMDLKKYTPAIDNNGNPKIQLMKSKIQFSFDQRNFDPNSRDTQSDLKKGDIYDLNVSGIKGEIEPPNPEQGGGMMMMGGGDYYSSMFMDTQALMKLAKDNKDFMYMDTKNDTYNQIWVQAESIDDVLVLTKQLRDENYQVSSALDSIKQMQESTKQLQGMLAAIGAISMLVAAIGIANTMLMSIYERTKEIGVIKVLGCKMSNICIMFLMEAMYIGLFGGILGLALSYSLSFALSAFLAPMGMASVIPAWLAGGGVLFSAIVAIVSGLYPAIRAVKLSPLEAIRTS